MTREYRRPDLQIPEIKVFFNKNGQEILFEKECLEKVDVYRRINKGEWVLLAKNTRAPFIDEETIDSPAMVEYAVKILDQEDNEIAARNVVVNI